jgi:hypothetical protein
MISGSMKRIQHLGDNDFDIVLRTHAEKQLQGLALQCFILTLKTLHDGQLMLVQQFGVIAIQPPQSLHSHKLHIVQTARLQQLGQNRSSLGLQGLIGVDC